MQAGIQRLISSGSVNLNRIRTFLGIIPFIQYNLSEEMTKVDKTSLVSLNDNSICMSNIEVTLGVYRGCYIILTLISQQLKPLLKIHSVYGSQHLFGSETRLWKCFIQCQSLLSTVSPEISSGMRYSEVSVLLKNTSIMIPEI